MNQVTDSFIDMLRAAVGDEQVITQINPLQYGSRDCYWFSPVLKRELGDKVADVMVRPTSLAQLVQVPDVDVEGVDALAVDGPALGLQDVDPLVGKAA